ncbi:pyrimidine-specific ribonucleoside hydrolase RihA [Nilaparvata lugens]|uniref:pyrimidine-specific ribonucleoside hydrolase RihA n=1 Tax=Nilaparvata lugens TaxID=108931 RepID=UPI00193C9AD1|nr:pyrimidine-specific ribonucleoside hydrolase RihA [Nilaparvata lugens]
MEAVPPTLCSRVNGVQLSSFLCCLVVVCTPVLVILYTLADDLGSDVTQADSLTHHELLVIDSDGSLDAAVAILAVLAHPVWGTRVNALTCVRGNASAEVLARGLVAVLRMAGRSEVRKMGTPVLVILYTLADDLGSDVTQADSLTHHELLVIDSDGSLDAAVAILAVLAHPVWGTRVNALTCVRGNASAEVLARGLVAVLRMAGRSEIPVYIGSPVDALQMNEVDDSNKLNSKDQSMTKTNPKNWLSLSNLLKLDTNLSLAQKEHAAVYLSNLVQQNSGMVSLLVLGPMTNVALAMRLNPDFMSQVKRLITLGGYIKGPGQGCYHYNKIESIDSIGADPDSAAFVLRGAHVHNFKITILPIDTITNNFISKAWLASHLNSTSDPIVNFILTTASLTQGDHWDIHALYAASILLQSNKSVTLKSDQYFVDVEVTGKLTRGVMVTDYYNVTGRKANADIVFEIDRTAIESLVVESFSKLDKNQ